jgi:hypothetical protein
MAWKPLIGNGRIPADVALSEPAAHYWKGKSGPAAGPAAFTASIRHQADGNVVRRTLAFARHQPNHETAVLDKAYEGLEREFPDRISRAIRWLRSD